MTTVDPTSRSLIVRATRILVIQIAAADAKPWTRKQAAQERSVALTLKVEEILKGAVRQKPGDQVKVDVVQVRRDIDWGGPPPGAWSSASVEPGTRLVAFGRSDSDDAAASLGDPGCIQLVPAAEALAEVHLAAQAEAAPLDLHGLVAAARSIAPSLGTLFADYLWVRHRADIVASFAAFDEVAGLLEDPKLGKDARTTLVMTLTMGVDTAGPKHLHRLAVALFRLLGLPEAARLHDNLVGTYLPNALALQTPHPRRAEDVFHDYPGEQARARAALHAYKGSAPVAPLLAWIDR